MAKQKYYVVWEGRTPGVYTTWAECQAQVNQYPQAKYKSYESKAEAQEAFEKGWKGRWGQGSGSTGSSTAKKKNSPPSPEAMEEINYHSVSVDVGTRGNPGPVEYKGVDTRTGEVIFSYGPIQKGTNNLGEFLAIVHALSYLKKEGSDKIIYSDSANAIKWVKQKAVSSTLVRDASTAEIWFLVDRAVSWLQNNTYTTRVVKWRTSEWGEIKADYGRK